MYGRVRALMIADRDKYKKTAFLSVGRRSSGSGVQEQFRLSTEQVSHRLAHFFSYRRRMVARSNLTVLFPRGGKKNKKAHKNEAQQKRIVRQSISDRKSRVYGPKSF